VTLEDLAVEAPRSPASEAPDVIAAQRGRLRTYLRRPLNVMAVGYLVLLVLAALLAPWLAPHDPSTQDLSHISAAMFTPGHPLGTDGLGRDVLSRMLYASRIALLAPPVAVGVAVLLGVPSGLLAGFLRGRLDAITGRLADALMALPPIILAMSIIAVLGPGLVNAMVAVGVILAPGLYRVVRGSTLAVRNEAYIDAAVLNGCRIPRVLVSHVLPNIASAVAVQVSLLFAFSLLAEASLSYLGLGVQPPDASWGVMLRQAAEDRFKAPNAVYPPGVAIMITVLAFNIVGDGLRDLVGRQR
jgi:peptide/nickel transport system permease protein